MEVPENLLMKYRPVLYYDFDEPFPERMLISDKSGHERHAAILTWATPAPRQVPGRRGQAIEFVTERRWSSPKGVREFDISQFLSVPNPLPDEATAFTIGLWFFCRQLVQKKDARAGFILATTSEMRHLDYEYAPRNGHGWALVTHAPYLRLPGIGPADITSRWRVPFQAGAWNQMIVSFNGSRLRAMVNGKMALDRPAQGALRGGTKLRIGAHLYHSHFQGKMDDFFILDRGLDQAEMSALYEAYGS